MIDHFAPQHSSPTAWAQMLFTDRIRQIMATATREIEAAGDPPLDWPVPGYDRADHIATMVALTPPVATAEVWRKVDREAREREETV
jgi:hypothetical protein